MTPQPSFTCTCDFPLCVCKVSTPVKTPSTPWLPPTPASSAKKPAVSSWTPTETAASPSPVPRPTLASQTAWESEVSDNLPASTLSKAKALSMLADYSSDLEEKDKIIKKLQLEIAESSLNREGQLTQLLWLDSLVNEKELELYNKDLAISALESTLSDRSSLINTITRQYKADIMALHKQHEADMSASQKRFHAMYSHCQNLSLELQRKEEKLDLLKESDRLQKQLSEQQRLLASSTVALYKQHKTRFIMGQHSLVTRSTDTSPEVQQEMSLAAARLRTEMAKQERATINMLSSAVDRLALKYDRYNMISHTNIHNTRCAPDGLPLIVPRDMMGLWLFADTTLEPTTEESAMYEFHMNQQTRPPPIYSPNLPRPTVNWTNLNKHRRKNLPDPELFPVLSVPADPTFYLDRSKYKPVDQHNNGEDPMTSARVIFGKDCGCAKCVPPFGEKHGLMTDMGIISMPESAVHGYRWDDVTATWVIATGC